MRNLLTILFLFTFLNGEATTFYFSASGNDNNAGTSTGAPWRTIAKFNSVFASKSPGDFFLFNRGDVFYGNLIISRSGSIGLPITIGAYGSGAQPIITGLSDVTGWTSLGSNKWQTSAAISNQRQLYNVFVNGVPVQQGRYPNAGYFTYQAGTQTAKTSGSLPASSTNWTGAVAVIRKNNWIMDNDTILTHAGTTFTHTYHDLPNNYPGLAGYGFFIQSDSRTLDVQNEWYYNPSSRLLMIYSTSSPVNVKVPTIDTLVTVLRRSYITFDNLSFIGSNKYTFFISGPNMTIQNCNIDYSGQEGIWGGNNFGSPFSPNFRLLNTTVNHTNNNSVTLQTEFTNYLIDHCTIKNSAVIPGMGKTGEKTYVGFFAFASGGEVKHCIIDSTGYIAVDILGNNIIIDSNYIAHWNLTKMDGGGVYTWLGSGTVNTGCKVYNNIIIDAFGATAGTTESNGLSHGVYLDANTNNYEVYNNTFANIGYSGMFMYSGASNNNFHNNTSYNNTITQLLQYNQFTNGQPTINNTVKSNILVSKTSTQLTGKFSTRDALSTFTASMGTFDSNYYARPIDDNLTIQALSNSGTNNYNLAQWKTVSGKDIHSLKSPIAIINVNQLDFEYNATENAVVKTLPSGVWVTLNNISYSGTATLQPYTSLVLINTGATNIAPTANAGIDITIQLPTSSVNLSGSGTDVDGSIVSYLWTKVSGTGGSIVAPNAASTSIVGLTQGVYQFKLAVTDNLGATGTDLVTVTVNPANISPSANAGTDQAITLPTSTVSLAGSGSDPDGSVTGYLWTFISGPNTPTITSATSASTTATGLVAGTYVFNLRVTDNQGATGNDQMTVIVSNSPNQAPTADAGIDQVIQLPTNSVNLSGSGNDPDGTISSYQWTKISGPAATITNASNASTSVTGLVQGVYQFKLQVTDNGGLTGSDIMTVTVNPANIPPTADAGTDQTITLPTTSVTLSGSASDADGSVSSHVWTKISGTGGTITNANNYTTTFTGLTPGIYVLRLTATDNQGATGFDEVTITVNSAINQNPTADAGSDQVLTWPTNSTTVNGGGTDPDGSIVAYNWTKVSGPASYSITNPNSATTTITNLVIGVYQFQLLVADNSGGTATDVIQITVNNGSASIQFNAPTLTQTYTGFALIPTATTIPAGLPYDITLDGTSGGKVNSGTYAAVAGISDPNYISTPASATFTINKQTIIINAVGKTVNFDGNPQSIVATTTPAVPGLVITYTYNGGPEPSAIGSYDVAISASDANHQATTVHVTLNIVSNPAIIFISDTLKTYNHASQNVTVTSAYSYSLTGAPQTAAGVYYPVTANITDGIHSGSYTATFTILKKPAGLSWAAIAPIPQGAQLTINELNAIADEPGHFVYSLPLGSVPALGVTGITATFVPDDPANIQGGTISNTISTYGTTQFLNYFITGPDGKIIFIKQ